MPIPVVVPGHGDELIEGFLWYCDKREGGAG